MWWCLWGKIFKKGGKMEEMEESGVKLSLGRKRVGKGGFSFVFYLLLSYFVIDL